MTRSILSRRQALMAVAALPLLPTLARPVRAAADMMGVMQPQASRFKLGAFEVTALMAGNSTVPDPHKMFGLNASDEEFAKASAESFIPADKAQFFFTPTVVNTGKELVLFDTGLSPEGTSAALKAAGYSPDQVDIVVLTHMHPDHIGGMMTASGPTFANARYVTGAVEHNYWMGAANEGFDGKVRPLNDKMAFLDDAGSVASGITAVIASGHTPGHMGYMLESEGKQLMLTADTANHYVWSLAYPDWQVGFDADKDAAAATRRKVFGMLAADKMMFLGYHMPFPSVGFIETRDDGFRYVPASYQTMLEG